LSDECEGLVASRVGGTWRSRVSHKVETPPTAEAAS